MTTPCLTRQNAFLLEDYELNSPLDLFCSICCQVSENELIKPCNCIVKNKPYLAHEKCFLDWSDKNGRPQYCTRCKSRYTLRKGYSRLEKFFFICSAIKTFKKSEIESQFGTETFKKVPDRLIIPTISAQCWKSSFSIPSFFISFSCFSIILLLSIMIAVIATRYFFHSRLTNK